MVNKRFYLKKKALSLRQNGLSLRAIEDALHVPKSTLSGWLRNVRLTKEQVEVLRKNWINGLVAAREKAIQWHNQQRVERMDVAKREALKVLNKIDYRDKNVMELSLAVLYLGEGLKGKSGTGMGSSDPLLLKFFIYAVTNLYGLPLIKLKAALHLRADQDPVRERNFWSRELGIPLVNFITPSIDRRTGGSPTYSNYHGVCVITCGNIAIQRKLVYLGRRFCANFAKRRAVSSAGRALP